MRVLISVVFMIGFTVSLAKPMLPLPLDANVDTAGKIVPNLDKDMKFIINSFDDFASLSENKAKLYMDMDEVSPVNMSPLKSSQPMSSEKKLVPNPVNDLQPKTDTVDNDVALPLDDEAKLQMYLDPIVGRSLQRSLQRKLPFQVKNFAPIFDDEAKPHMDLDEVYSQMNRMKRSPIRTPPFWSSWHDQQLKLGLVLKLREDGQGKPYVTECKVDTQTWEDLDSKEYKSNVWQN